MTCSSSLPPAESNRTGSAAPGPLRRSLELNVWLALSAATYVVTLLLARQHPNWSPGAKVALSLGPILPGMLYLWKGLRHLQARDELQRRIQLEAWLLAGFGTVVITTVINVCNAQGLAGPWSPHGLEVGGTYMTMFLLWSVGVTVANLRYR